MRIVQIILIFPEIFMGTVLSFIFIALISINLQAQVFQCEKNGQVAFQDTPCSSDAKSKIVKADADRGNVVDFNYVDLRALKSTMSVDDVRRMIPSAVIGTSTKGPNVSFGALDAKLNIQGVDFQARFAFMNGRFFQASLTSFPETQKKIALADYKKLISAFRSRYGRENGTGVPVNIPGEAESTDWDDQNGHIWISWVGTTPDASHVAIGYQAH
ncbi:MAG: DUF4124 domain-containing protein [Burkholderiales bacterium]|nr:DUF4124 domain-containing protein [Burkholderiales bacterium]